MLQLENNTPFEAHLSYLRNENDMDAVYTLVKATFTLEDRPRMAEHQVPVCLADEYRGSEGESSLKYASELHPLKKGTDLILIGEACAPDKKKTREIDVRFSVADYQKTVRVFGDRAWESGVWGLRPSLPLPFESMPLVYERAFGGIHDRRPQKDTVLFEGRNPLGKGFSGKRPSKDIKGIPLPNLEDPAHLIKSPKDTPPPACFSFMSPQWEPRLGFAGTYDEAWQRERAPYLPHDFDPRFFNSAHPDLICKGYLEGGEPVRLDQVSPDGPMAFCLPRCEFDIKVHMGRTVEQSPAYLETAVFEPLEKRFTLLFKAETECRQSLLKVEKAVIGLSSLTFPENGGLS